MKKKFIVTGGAGFIGSHLVDLLIKNKHEVIIIDDLSTGSIKNINEKAIFKKINLNNLKKIDPFFKNCDGVFHFAALPRIQPSFEEPILHNQVNITNTLNVLQSMKNNNVKKIVYSSTSACYGNPAEIPTSEKCPIDLLNPYALQKYTSEQYALILSKKFKINAISLRYFNVYGPRSYNPKNKLSAYSSVVGIFNYAKNNKLPIKITGDGKQKRDFVHVFDVARANYIAMKSKKSGQIYNIGTGKSISIKELSYLFTNKPSFIKERFGEANITCASIKKVKKELGWYPKLKLENVIKTGLV